MKKYFLILFSALVIFVAIHMKVDAVNVSVPSSPAIGSVLIGNANGTYNASTSPVSVVSSSILFSKFPNNQTLCVKSVNGLLATSSADCNSGGGGSGSISTSSAISVNNFPFWTSVNGAQSGTSTLTTSAGTISQAGNFNIFGVASSTELRSPSGTISVLHATQIYDSSATSTQCETADPVTGLISAGNCVVSLNNLTGNVIMTGTANHITVASTSGNLVIDNPFANYSTSTGALSIGFVASTTGAPFPTQATTTIPSPVGFAVTLAGWKFAAPSACTSSIDVWRGTNGVLPTSSASSIFTSSTYPVLKGQTFASSSNIAGWSTAINVDDVLVGVTTSTGSTAGTCYAGGLKLIYKKS